MTFRLNIMPEARAQLAALKSDAGQARHYKACKDALNYLERNPKHPGLNSHPYETQFGPNGEQLFESYAENNTPGAYRIFWFYGPERRMISVLTVIPHPDDH